MSDSRRFYCNTCERHTTHRLLWHNRRHYEGDEHEEWTIDYADRNLQIWECQGCEEAAFLLLGWSTSEDPEPVEESYPERSQRKVKPKKYRRVSLFIAEVYEESVRAFNANCPILCAAGLRTLLEAICKDKRGPGALPRNLKGKIDSLSRVVPGNIVGNLHGLRFMGNRAVHDLHAPSLKDLALGIEVMEDVMTVIYELNYKSGRLFQRLSQQASPPGGDPLADD